MKSWQKSKPIALFFRGSLSFRLLKIRGKKNALDGETAWSWNPSDLILCRGSHGLDAICILLEESNERKGQRDTTRRERVKRPSPITALEGVMKVTMAGQGEVRVVPRRAARIIHTPRPLALRCHSERLYPKGHRMARGAPYPFAQAHLPFYQPEQLEVELWTSHSCCQPAHVPLWVMRRRFGLYVCFPLRNHLPKPFSYVSSEMPSTWPLHACRAPPPLSAPISS